MVGRSANAHAPAGQSVYDDVEADNDVDGDVDLCHFVKRFRLRDRAGETVQDVTVPRVRLRQSVRDYADDDFVGNERTRVDVGFGELTELRPFLDVSPEDVAGGDVWNAVFFCDQRRLRAFARAGSAQHDDVFHCYLTSGSLCSASS